MTTTNTTATDSNQADPFEGADYYDCADNAEHLEHGTPVDAIAAYVYDWAEVMPDKPDVAKFIAEEMTLQERTLGAFTVTAYARMVITENDLRTAAEMAAEYALEQLDDEYGDPDGGYATEDAPLLADALLPTLREWVKEHFHVWNCKRVAQRTYTAAEVDALLREHRPEWFEPSEATP